MTTLNVFLTFKSEKISFTTSHKSTAICILGMVGRLAHNIGTGVLQWPLLYMEYARTKVKCSNVHQFSLSAPPAIYKFHITTFNAMQYEMNTLPTHIGI